jgi:hypothetical protein
MPSSEGSARPNRSGAVTPREGDLLGRLIGRPEGLHSELSVVSKRPPAEGVPSGSGVTFVIAFFLQGIERFRVDHVIQEGGYGASIRNLAAWRLERLQGSKAQGGR